MKTYAAPKLIARGPVVELTRGSDIDVTDPDMVTKKQPLGSVGFNL